MKHMIKWLDWLDKSQSPWAPVVFTVVCCAAGCLAVLILFVVAYFISSAGV